MAGAGKLRVAVLYGGRSGEHEISIRSAEAIVAGLDSTKYEVQRIFITPDGRWQPATISPEPGANPGIDVVFPVLHGTFGEDGTVQGLLELSGLPYVGCGVLASAVCMDKDVLKRLLLEHDLPVVEYSVVARGQYTAADYRDLTYPVFVKPANLGSSVGISKVARPDDLGAALDLAAQFDRKILIERGIAGREFECSVMGNSLGEAEPIAAIPCEVLPSREFYDYEDKYILGTSKTVLPADLTSEQTTEIRRLAVEAYKAAECEGMARVDFLLETATNKFYINEINTIPGFTSISMYPKMWEAAGVPFGELLDRLIGFALERSRARSETRYTK
ncbi:MAG: D-alanine--D-alanine ligase family protein [Acidobacteriota bacterium]